MLSHLIDVSRNDYIVGAEPKRVFFLVGRSSKDYDMGSSSNTNQTGTTCGLPSLLTVVSFAVKVPCIRNFVVSFLDM
ncbi:MAG: hypothetical protein WAU25_12705 [Nitrososphaeraceae archaeon]